MAIDTESDPDSQVEGSSARPVSPPPTGWRDRLLPRTALGMSAMLLCAALGAAFSGAILYAYYEWRRDQSDDQIARYVESFKDEVETARNIVRDEADDAREAVRDELEPLQKLAPSGETLTGLLNRVGPSVWFVVTRDEDGQPSVGSGFVVLSDDEQTYLLTSYTAVRAATRTPAPPITVRKGDDELPASLFTWDDQRDLALITIERGGLQRVEWGASDSVRTGDRLFVLSGLGAAGGSVIQGSIADVSASAIQHDAAVGDHFRGGPLLNSDGEVVGVASRNYTPLGFASRDVYFSVPIREACAEVLRCPDGVAGGARSRPPGG